VSLLRRTPAELAALERAKARLDRLDFYPRKVDIRHVQDPHVAYVDLVRVEVEPVQSRLGPPQRGQLGRRAPQRAHPLSSSRTRRWAASSSSPRRGAT